MKESKEKDEFIPYHRPYKFTENERVQIDCNIEEVLQSGQLTNGKFVRELEEKIRKMYKVDYAIATANCTLGLMFCYDYLRAFSRTIFIPVFTWDSVYLALKKLDYIIEFCDIDKNTWHMNGSKYRRNVSPNHTFGSVDVVRDKFVIYDGAHALGCKLEDIGMATVFSLAATKIVTSCEGGIIITNHKTLAHWCKHNRDKMGRMSEVNAIIGLATLKHLDKIKRWKKKVFKYYRDHLPGKFQDIPIESNYNTIGFLNTELLVIPKKIETRQYYEPVWNDGKSFPNARYVFRNIYCLPSWYGVDYKKIVDLILDKNYRRV